MHSVSSSPCASRPTFLKLDCGLSHLWGERQGCRPTLAGRRPRSADEAVLRRSTCLASTCLASRPGCTTSHRTILYNRWGTHRPSTRTTASPTPQSLWRVGPSRAGVPYENGNREPGKQPKWAVGTCGICSKNWRSSRVLDIAIEAGYDTHEAFTRAFRKNFGLNPREYREDVSQALRSWKPDSPDLELRLVNLLDLRVVYTRLEGAYEHRKEPVEEGSPWRLLLDELSALEIEPWPAAPEPRSRNSRG